MQFLSQLNSNQNEAGIALLYTVIVSSVVILIGASITSIVLREFDLVISSESSVNAFNAADTGLECAIFHDRQSGTSTFPEGSGAISCAGDSSVDVSKSGSIYTFLLDDNNGNAEVCARVRVKKNSTEPYSNVESRGFNTCVTSDRQSERALRSSY